MKTLSKSNTNILILLLIAILVMSCNQKNTSISKNNQDINNMNDGVMKFSFKSEKNKSEKSIKFILTVERLKLIDEEYFPNSEQIRFIIFDNEGNIIRESNKGMSFMQMIFPVQPLEINGVYDYEIIWDGLDNDGNLVRNGKYKVELILPAKPKIYNYSVEIEWRNDDWR